jgi:hypothetical protein
MKKKAVHACAYPTRTLISAVIFNGSYAIQNLFQTVRIIPYFIRCVTNIFGFIGINE